MRLFLKRHKKTRRLAGGLFQFVFKVLNNFFHFGYVVTVAVFVTLRLLLPKAKQHIAQPPRKTFAAACLYFVCLERF